MSTSLIKVTLLQGTYLKVTPDFQASAPENKDKVFVPYDTSLTLIDLGASVKNHRFIQFKDLNNELQSWYIYDPHWTVIKSDDPDYINNTPQGSTQQKTSTLIPTKEQQFIQSQINKLNKYSVSGKANLNTSCVYFSQRDNYTMPHRTCNSSSNAMYLNWLQRSTGKSGITSDDSYLRNLLKIGDTIYHENQTRCLKQYGFNTVWGTDGNFKKLRALVEAGFVVPINILHRGTKDNPRGGHIICLIGYRQSGDYISHDPYGTLESNYTNSNGRYSFLSKEDLQSRWEGGYRYLA